MLTLIVALVAIVPMGLWLRWSTAGIRLGYLCGRQAERLNDPPRQGRLLRRAYRLGFEAGKRRERAAVVSYLEEVKAARLAVLSAV